ncbi:MAG: DsbE family thiol:disulfide interchange protein [Rhizobiaceae bacterium]|jgi:cytochrome c biogenesis protein CcmG/thiol:disulfide interchange protein DsbE|nr:DsbE family thiol:disulfide interchange protein [Rhizobiaceae bacterium]
MSAGPDSAPGRPPQRGRMAFLLPLILFLGLAGFFAAQLLSGRDIAVVPSALIGQPAPQTVLQPLGQTPLFDVAAAKGRVTIVNVWASWCAPCREEHPLLIELAKDDRFTVAGINYKDDPANALGFLAELGNPFAAIGADQTGRAAIEWGVYGVPETFIVGADGLIAYKHVGPLTAESLNGPFMAALEAALAAAR